MVSALGFIYRWVFIRYTSAAVKLYLTDQTLGQVFNSRSAHALVVAHSLPINKTEQLIVENSAKNF